MLIVWPSRYELSQGFGIAIPVATTGTAPIPVINTTTYSFKVDWDGDGDFSEASEDITSSVKSARWSRGFDSERGTAQVGQLELRLNNAAGTFTPTLHPTTVKLGRLVQVSTTTGGQYVLFTGYISEVTPHPEMSDQDCYLVAVDGMDYLSRCEINTGYYTMVTDLGPVGLALDGASWPSYARNIDSLGYVLGAWSALGDNARAILEKLAATVGGRCYVDRNGYFCYEDRAHRTTRHPVSVYSFNNSMVSIAPQLSPRDIYNVVKMDYLQQSDAEPGNYLWDIIPWRTIAPGETVTYNPRFTGPAQVVSTYVQAQTSRTDTTNRLADLTITSTYYADSATIVLTNNAVTSLCLVELALWGVHYKNMVGTITAEDAASQTAYQKRTLALDGYLHYQAVGDPAQYAQVIVDETLARSKAPHADLEMVVLNKTAALLQQMLALDISDRVTVVNTTLGINGDYYIESVSHEVSEGGLLHQVTYRLSEVVDASLLLDLETVNLPTWADASAYGNNGTVNGAVLSGGKLLFDSGNDYATVAYDKRIGSAREYSFGGWLKRTDADATVWIGGNYTESDVPRGWYAMLNSNTIVVSAGGGTFSVGLGTPDIADLLWHLFVFTLDATALNMYVDGQLLHTFSVAGLPQRAAALGTLYIGTNPVGVGVNGWGGYMDKVRFWNRSLSPAQVASLYAGEYATHSS